MAGILSLKAQRLQPEDIDRYHEKIQVVDGIDPYTMKLDPGILPLTVDYDKIFTHLITKHSFRTGQPHRNMKSLDAYKAFQTGFVKEVKGCKHKGVFVVSGKVLHSMSIGEPPAECWLLIQDEDSEDLDAGSVVAAHCDCTAGAGETCTHVAATLYALSYAREICLGKQLSVTELPAYWTAPGGSAASQNLFKPIDEVSFGRKRETFCDLRNFNLEKTDDDYKLLISKLVEAGQEVAVEKAFFPKPAADEDEELDRKREIALKLSFVNKYDESFKDQSIDDLRTAVKFIDWHITKEECDLIEEVTRDQSAGPIWFKMRLGRVTASNFKRCVSTSILNPSKTLLNAIFAGNRSQNIPACLYGRAHEADGIAEAIKCFQIQKHRNVLHYNSGLIISTDYPYFAPSPDQIITCDCCGKVTVEVKCPFKFENLNREEGINVLLHQKPPYLKRNSNGSLVMNREHPYYFQVQMQIVLANASYGFFVVYAPNFRLFLKVNKNDAFWELNAKKGEDFFENVLGPEIIGHYYSSRG